MQAGGAVGPWPSSFVSDVHLIVPVPVPVPGIIIISAVEIRSYFNVGVGKPGITLFLEVVMMDINHINISDISSHIKL